jgi:hypothetical protein
MTDYANISGSALTSAPDADDVPIRQALAMFISDDIDDAGAEITAVTNMESAKYKKYFVASDSIFFLCALVFVAVFFTLIFSAENPVETKNSLLNISLGSLIVAAIPRILIQAFQYGWGVPEVPLVLPHAGNKRIDEFLALLQKESGPKSYCYSLFQKRRVSLGRRQFFGKLRYLLFSEHGSVRRMVVRFPTGLPSPTDIFLRRPDVEKMIEASKPKRKGGPGRAPSPRYTDAIIALLGNQILLQLGVADSEQAIDQITKWMADWFEENADESGWVPRKDQIKPYAEKIYAHLKFLSAKKLLQAPE